jgi:hypothetical protein
MLPKLVSLETYLLYLIHNKNWIVRNWCVDPQEVFVMGYPIDTEYRARETYRAHLNTIEMDTLLRQARSRKRSVRRKITYKVITVFLKVWFSIRRLQRHFENRQITSV